METLLPGITAERVPASRLTVAVLSVAGRTGEPVVFVHGNVSSLFWQGTLCDPSGAVGADRRRPLSGHRS